MQPIDIIVKDQDILGGTPVFRGTRVPFQALLDYLEGGQTLDEFLDDFPTVTKDAAVAALEAGLAGQKNGLLLSLAEDAGFALSRRWIRASSTSRIWPAAVSRF